MEEKQSRIFICASHTDAPSVAKLRKHLTALGVTSPVWAAQNIEPGQKWRQEIAAALAAAKVAVLLITPQFLASEFIATHELPVLLTAAHEGHVALLSVLIRPSVFADTPLAAFPSVDLTAKTGKRLDEAWEKIAQRLLQAMTAELRPS